MYIEVIFCTESSLRIWSHLLKKSVMENFIFCAVLQSDFHLDPDGKIFKDIWNMGTNYMDNKFYFYEMNGSEATFIFFIFIVNLINVYCFSFLYYHERLKFCACIYFCKSNSVSLTTTNVTSREGLFEGYKINLVVLTPTKAIKIYKDKDTMFLGILVS